MYKENELRPAPGHSPPPLGMAEFEFEFPIGSRSGSIIKPLLSAG